MASKSLLIVLILVAACSAFVARADVGETRTWCLKSAAEQAYCTNLTAILEAIDPYNHTWACVTKDGEDGCIEAVNAGEADFVSVDGGDIYSAYTKYGMKVIASEQNALGGTDYWAVAVVRAADCGDKTTLEDFKGKNSCHTGYRRSAGWSLPVWAAAVNRTLIPKVNVNSSMPNDMEMVEAFFGSVCAPGTGGNAVCSLCPDNCDSTTSTYVDYDGALNCLMNGGGDIAFTKHGIAEDYASDGPLKADWSILPASDLRILCPDGGCQATTSYKTCNWGETKGHGIIAAKALEDEEIPEYQEILLLLNNNAQFIDRFLSGKNTDSLIFKSDTQRLAAVNGTAETFLGDQFNVLADVPALDTSVPLGTGAASTVRASLLGAAFAFVAVLMLW